LVYILGMSKSAYAKLFMNGRSQAVRLPKEFRLPGDRVRVRKVGSGVLLEPIAFDTKAWFAAMDRAGAKAGPFMPEGRNQPKAPKRRVFD